MRPTQTIESAVAAVVSRIDFASIHKAMRLSGWQWGCGQESKVPTMSELTKTAEDLVREVLKPLPAGKTERQVGSGGFRAERKQINGQNFINLSFVFRETGWYQSQVR